MRPLAEQVVLAGILRRIMQKAQIGVRLVGEIRRQEIGRHAECHGKRRQHAVAHRAQGVEISQHIGTQAGHIRRPLVAPAQGLPGDHAGMVGPAVVADEKALVLIGPGRLMNDRGPDHPSVITGKPLRGRNQWPADMPGLRADMLAYFDALGAMCDRMLPPFAVALGMPADFLAPYFADEAHANLRFLHYPPQDAGEYNLFGQGPHTDNGFMTALARTDVPGLAVRLPSGEWFPPPVIPGTFLINLGNIMRRWSNDRFLSTPHGVLNDSGTDRYSIAYFHSPNPDRVIECLPSCTGAGNPPHYPPAVYRDLVLEFYRANYFHQKGHRSDAALRAAE